MKNKMLTRRQRTIKESVEFAGLGIHTGVEVRMRFCPAPINAGIKFKRVDLPGHPAIPATISSVCDTTRSTSIGSGKVFIHTVEHVLAAVKAFDIDNLYIELSNIEPPVADGSSSAFVKMIEIAGIEEQNQDIPIYKVKQPLHYSADDDKHILVLPCDEYRISYTLNYPTPKILQAQFHSVLINTENFKQEISPCRTFSRYEEVAYLMDKGLIKGGSLNNAVIIKDDAVLSNGGLHFPNEMVRHKILDVIGDLSLVGVPFLGHVISLRSGHAANYQLAKKIKSHLEEEFK